MKMPILQRWTYASPRTAERMIIPDGCQDLLYWVVPGMRPRWTVSHLQAGVMAVRIPQGATIVGFRFAPGTELPERVRSELTERPGDDPDHTLDAVMESIGYDQRVAESLVRREPYRASAPG